MNKAKQYLKELIKKIENDEVDSLIVLCEDKDQNPSLKAIGPTAHLFGLLELEKQKMLQEAIQSQTNVYMELLKGALINDD